MTEFAHTIESYPLGDPMADLVAAAEASHQNRLAEIERKFGAAARLAVEAADRAAIRRVFGHRP